MQPPSAEPVAVVYDATADPLLLKSYARSLRARIDLAPGTIHEYLATAGQFAAFLAAQGMPQTPAALSREHVESWLAALKARPGRRGLLQPSTIQTRFLCLQRYFAWLVEEGEMRASPMVHLKVPKVEAPEVRVYEPEELRRLLATCEKAPDFVDRRDYALLLLLLDTGMRIGEATGLLVADVDLDAQEARVLGKGRRPRRCHFGVRTTQALDRYLRTRKRHPHAADPAFWIGQQGGLDEDRLYHIVKERAAAAGLPDLHPHSLRHQAAHSMLAAGMQEGDVMRQLGWRSRSMLGRYAASRADERAKEAHRKYGLGDKL